MRLIYTLFLLLFININAQYNVGVDLNYHPIIDEQQTYYAITNSTTPQGYTYFYATNKYGNDSYLRKVLPTGYNDTSFGNNGVSTSLLPLEYNSSGYATGGIIASDQAIFLFNKKVIAKYDVNGNLDTSFGTGGYFTSPNDVKFLSINNDSSLFILTNTLYKLTSNGQLDVSFVDIPAFTYQTTNSGIIVRMSSGADYKKYSLTGVQDMTFGTGGVASITGSNIKVNKNTGEIFVYSNSYPIQVKKYTANGTLDPAFGNGGTASYSFPVNPDIYYPNSSAITSGVEIDSNNNVLVYGGSDSGVENQKTAFIIRFTSNGILDNSFNSGSGLYYRQGAPYINSMRMLNDNTYLCVNIRRFGSMSYNIGTTQYLRTTGSLNVNDIEKSNFSIYPNPVKDVFNVVLSTNEKLESIKVFDMSGRLLKVNTSLKNNTLEGNKGIYLLEVKTNRNNYKTKIIKD